MYLQETAEFKKISDDEAEGLLGGKENRLVFGVGEIVELHGFKFRVRKITKKDLILRGVPEKQEALGK